jgi:ABC-type transport system substrate-binding protein
MLALCATALAPGCDARLPAPLAAAQEGDGALPHTGGTLHLASFADIRNLDPAGPVDLLAEEATHLLFAGLVDFDEAGTIVTDLADHWQVDEGGRIYRFSLRPGVTMHDGNELTAEDVKRSAERALHPSSPNPNASYFAGIVGYPEYAAGNANTITGIAVEGRYVVSFSLREPDASFLSLVAMDSLRPVCRSAGERYVDTWLPCGAGPFRLVAGGWQRGSSLRLVRHEAYFRLGLPYLDAVEWTYGMQFLAQRLRFEQGDLDVIRDLTQADLARFLSDPRWRSLGSAETNPAIYGESMNTRLPPFDNIEIRRAVAAAIDRDHYVALKPANMVPLSQALPPHVLGYDPTFEGQRYDPRAALEHMRKAGYPFDPNTGRGGWPEPVPYVLYDQGVAVYTSQILQQELAKIGIRLELHVVSFPAFLAMRTQPDRAGMSLGSWALDFPDPSSLFEPLFGSAALQGEATSSSSFFSDRRLDELLARAHRELDPQARALLYREANEVVCDAAPWAFTFGYHFFDIRQPYVRGFVQHPVWVRDVSRVWLDRKPVAPLTPRPAPNPRQGS